MDNLFVLKFNGFNLQRANLLCHALLLQKDKIDLFIDATVLTRGQENSKIDLADGWLENYFQSDSFVPALIATKLKPLLIKGSWGPFNHGIGTLLIDSDVSFLRTNEFQNWRNYLLECVVMHHDRYLLNGSRSLKLTSLSKCHYINYHNSHYDVDMNIFTGLIVNIFKKEPSDSYTEWFVRSRRSHCINHNNSEFYWCTRICHYLTNLSHDAKEKQPISKIGNNQYEPVPLARSKALGKELMDCYQKLLPGIEHIFGKDYVQFYMESDQIKGYAFKSNGNDNEGGTT